MVYFSRLTFLVSLRPSALPCPALQRRRRNHSHGRRPAVLLLRGRPESEGGGRLRRWLGRRPAPPRARPPNPDAALPEANHRHGSGVRYGWWPHLAHGGRPHDRCGQRSFRADRTPGWQVGVGMGLSLSLPNCGRLKYQLMFSLVPYLYQSADTRPVFYPRIVFRPLR